MKVSLKQLELVVTKMKYQLLGYNNNASDVVMDISFSQEDPGSGAMVECMTLKATKPAVDGEEINSETRMEIEIYPDSEKIEPRASKTESYKINDKNRY